MPQIIASGVGGCCCILGQPDLVATQCTCIHLLAEPGLVGIHTCGVSCILNGIAECLTYCRSGSGIDLITSSAASFHIQEYRIGNLVTADTVQYHGGFLYCLDLIHCLGKEVYTHFQSCCRSSLDVGLEGRVIDQCSLRGTAITHTDDHVADTGILHGVPVNFSIPLGHIDSHGAGANYQRSVTGKIVFCALNDLFSGNLVAIRCKEIKLSVQCLPSGVFHITFDKELRGSKVIRIDCFTIAVTILYIQLYTALVFQLGSFIFSRIGSLYCYCALGFHLVAAFCIRYRYRSTSRFHTGDSNGLAAYSHSCYTGIAGSRTYGSTSADFCGNCIRCLLISRHCRFIQSNCRRRSRCRGCRRGRCRSCRRGSCRGCRRGRCRSCCCRRGYCRSHCGLCSRGYCRFFCRFCCRFRCWFCCRSCCRRHFCHPQELTAVSHRYGLRIGNGILGYFFISIGSCGTCHPLHSILQCGLYSSILDLCILFCSIDLRFFLDLIGDIDLFIGDIFLYFYFLCCCRQNIVLVFIIRQCVYRYGVIPRRNTLFIDNTVHIVISPGHGLAVGICDGYAEGYVGDQLAGLFIVEFDLQILLYRDQLQFYRTAVGVLCLFIFLLFFRIFFYRIGCRDLCHLCVCHCQKSLLTDHLDAVQLCSHADELRYLSIHCPGTGIDTSGHDSQNQYRHSGSCHDPVHGTQVQEFCPDYSDSALLFAPGLSPARGSRLFLVILVGIILFIVTLFDVLHIIGIVLLTVFFSGVLFLIGVVLLIVFFSGVLFLISIVLFAVFFSGVLFLISIVLFAVVFSGVLFRIGIVLFTVVSSGVFFLIGIVLFAVSLFRILFFVGIVFLAVVFSGIFFLVPIVTILYVFFPVTVRTFCMVK